MAYFGSFSSCAVSFDFVTVASKIICWLSANILMQLQLRQQVSGLL